VSTNHTETLAPVYGWTNARYDVSGFNEQLVRASTHDGALAQIATLQREVEELRESARVARVELAALISRPDLRAHPSDIPASLNEADRECVAKAFNALSEALSQGSAT